MIDTAPECAGTPGPDPAQARHTARALANTTTRSHRQTPALRTAILVGLLCASLALTGCAYQNAVDRADLWAQQGQWERALEEYRKANRLDPDGEDAIAGMVQAKTQIATRLLDGAARSLDARDYEGAFEQADAAGQFAPDEPRVWQLYEAITSRIIAEATELISSGAHLDGLALLEMLIEQRPEIERALNDTVKQAELSWADRLRGQAASDEEAGHTAPAFVRMAMASALSNTKDDVASRERLRRAIVSDQAYAVRLGLTADAVRAADVRERFNGHLARGRRYIRIVDKPRDPGVTITAKISKGVCKQTSRSDVASHRYISGTRQIPNPAWERLQDDLLDAERDLLNLEQRSDDALERLERAEDELERAIENNSSSISSRRNDVQNRRRELFDARKRMRRARQESLNIRDRINREQPFTEEDVYSTFNYEVKHWTRTCTITLEGTISEADGAKARPFKTTEAAATSDKSHDAFVRFNIPQDRLNFPSSDASLVQHTDTLVARTLANMALERMREHRERLIAEAQAVESADLAEATRLYLLAFVLEPDDGLTGPGLWLRETYHLRDIYVLTRRPAGQTQKKER